MSISKAFNALGDQLIQEQNILKDGWTGIGKDIKEYLDERKLKKFYEKVDLIGPSALKDSVYQESKDVVSKVIDMEHQFRLDTHKREFVKDDPDSGIILTTEDLARLKTYGKDRKEQSVFINLECSAIRPTLRDDLDLARKASFYLDGIEQRSMGEEVRNDLDVAKNSIDKSGQYQWGTSCNLDDFPKLQDNKEFVIFAVSNKGTDLQFASERLKDDIEVARASHKHWQDDGIQFISARLKDDKAFASEITMNDGFKLPYFSENVRDDIYIVHRAIKNASDKLIEDASTRLQDIAGKENPAENLQRAINSEKFSSSLESKLSVKNEAPTKKMKI